MMHRRYTDAPLLPQSLFLGSIRLLFWLFFHPAAWRSHLVRLDMRLPPDFCLADLDGRHWRSTAVWRFLIQTYLAWPLLVALALTVLLMLWRLPTAVIFFGVMLGVTFGIVASLAASLAGSVAIGVTIGIATGLAVGLGGGLIFNTPTGLEINGIPYGQDMVIAVLIGLMSGLAGGLAYGVGMGLTREKREEASFSLLRQVSGVFIGIMIGMGAGQLAALAPNDWLAGLVSAVLFGTAVGWRTGNIRRGLLAGVVLGMVVVGAGWRGGGGGQVAGLLAFVAAAFALPYALAEKVAGAWAAGLAGALGGGGGLFLFASGNASIWPFLWFSLAGILWGLTLAWWRPVLMYPFLLAWNALLYRLDERRLTGQPANPRRQAKQPAFRLHSAFWDEFQRLPLLNLDDYLLFVLQKDTAEARTAMAYLSSTRQRWAAQSAQIELDARQLAQCGSASAIAAVHPGLATSDLTGPASALLRSFSRISGDVAAALQQESAYNKRLALHAVEDRLDGLLRELTRSNEPYAARFRPIAAEWRRIIGQEEQLLAAEAELRQEIDSPYIIGVPLTEKQEIFIGRTDVSGRIEQLLRDRRQPPLLLYGQRRVGKTSLLNNLGRLLPGSIVPMFVDLQGPASRAQDEAGFLYNMGRGMAQSAQRQRAVELPPLTRGMLADDPFTQFDEWLDAVEGTLGDQLALLMLDEFEVLERVLERERFDPEIVLGMLRHLIQHRPKFKVLLSGSHTLDEFQRWSSYLINVQVIHIGYLNEAEARQLIEAPVKGFALRYEASASQRVLELTRGHPFLVQLLGAEIVALKNEQPPLQRRLATVADVETAVPEALQHGSFFFADIKQNQVDAAGLDALSKLAAAGEGAHLTLAELGGDGLVDTLRGLCHREIVELVDGRADGRYRFQIELVRRWLQAN